MTLARPAPGSQVRLELPVRAVLELHRGVHAQGISFEPELLYETRDFGAGWRWSASGSLVLGDSRLNNYFYGVSPQFASAARPAYEAQAGLIATRLGLSAAKDLTPDVRVFGFVRYERYDGGANRASPLFLQSHGASAGIGLTWTLGRSARRAVD
jgi:outer membrane scaffolding protein for murein synthesis (MipA/OmpV family)